MWPECAKTNTIFARSFFSLDQLRISNRPLTTIILSTHSCIFGRAFHASACISPDRKPRCSKLFVPDAGRDGAETASERQAVLFDPAEVTATKRVVTVMKSCKPSNPIKPCDPICFAMGAAISTTGGITANNSAAGLVADPTISVLKPPFLHPSFQYRRTPERLEGMPWQTTTLSCS